MRKHLALFALALFLCSFSSVAIAGATPVAPSEAGVVNINTADASQLSLLPRVGEKAAQRIIEYRTQHGPFKKPSDLMQVKGVGEKTYANLSRYIAVEGKTTLTSKIASPRKPRANKPAPTASH